MNTNTEQNRTVDQSRPLEDTDTEQYKTVASSKYLNELTESPPDYYDVVLNIDLKQKEDPPTYSQLFSGLHCRKYINDKDNKTKEVDCLNSNFRMVRIMQLQLVCWSFQVGWGTATYVGHKLKNHFITNPLE